MSEPLTSRDVDILRHVADGLTAQESAVRLGLAWRTVTTYREEVKAKLGARNIANAVKLGYESGYLGGEVA